MQKRIQQMTAGGAGAQPLADLAEDLVEQAYDDARRSARVASGVMAGVLAALAGGLGLAALSAALDNAGASASLGVSAALGVAAALLGVSALVLGRNFLALRPPPRELVASGIPARLTVRDYRSAPGGFRLRSTSSSVDFTRVALDLDVAPAGGAAYAVTVRQYLAGRAFSQLAPGATLAGYVDRADPARIFIDWRGRAAG